MENPATCGDGRVNQVGEQCDDANLTNGDGCSATCQFEIPVRIPGPIAASASCLE